MPLLKNINWLITACKRKINAETQTPINNKFFLLTHTSLSDLALLYNFTEPPSPSFICTSHTGLSVPGTHGVISLPEAFSNAFPSAWAISFTLWMSSSFSNFTSQLKGLFLREIILGHLVNSQLSSLSLYLGAFYSFIVRTKLHAGMLWIFFILNAPKEQGENLYCWLSFQNSAWYCFFFLGLGSNVLRYLCTLYSTKILLNYLIHNRTHQCSRFMHFMIQFCFYLLSIWYIYNPVLWFLRR